MFLFRSYRSITVFTSYLSNLLLVDLLLWFSLCVCPHVKCISTSTVAVFVFVGMCIHTVDGKSEEMCIFCLVSDGWMCRICGLDK